jgi:hypothetical protein
MKENKNLRLLFSIMLLSSLCNPAHAFSGKTHKALTEKAVQDSTVNNYLMNNLSMNQGLGAMLLLDQSTVPEPNRIPPDQFEERIFPELPSNPCTIMDFLKAGANLEDVPLPRARHHFHAPIANTGVSPPNPNAGLDNKTDHPELANHINKLSNIIYGLSFDVTGASALKRASGTEDPNWETEYQNYFAWPDIRDYFYKALTEESSATREHYLALMFLSLGHTVHLLEDMGVPAHTRNDFISGHYRNAINNGNPFENWVEDRVEANGGQSPWSGSGLVVFDKLAKYFDADVYAGAYLGDGILPPETWGLSACSNYQFLSTSTMFGCSGTKYQFPNPGKPNTMIITEANKKEI